MQDRVFFLLDFLLGHQLFFEAHHALVDISLLSVLLGMKVAV